MYQIWNTALLREQYNNKEYCSVMNLCEQSLPALQPPEQDIEIFSLLFLFLEDDCGAGREKVLFFFV